MHIPTVTDQMLDKVLEAAASPVFVEFTEGGSENCFRVHHRIAALAEEFDDRVIFLRLDCDENPRRPPRGAPSTLHRHLQAGHGIRPLHGQRGSRHDGAAARAGDHGRRVTKTDDR
jgi:hypothetical protein